MPSTPTITAAAAGCLLLVLTGCGGGGGGQPSASPTAPSTGLPGSTSAPAPSGSLSATEASDLGHVRAVEKAGEDAYRQFAGRYGSLPVFANLAASQATQSAAVTAMMARFRVPDPLQTAPAGQFSDPAVQRMYNSAIDSGQSSAQNALSAMADFERKTLTDLRRVRSGTAQPDLQRMYSNLEDAANRHIDACTKALQQHPSPS